MACSVGGMVHYVCAQVCWHLLSRPDNADSGSRISWRQTAHSASPLVSGSVFWGPTCCLLASVDACLPRFPTGDGRANTPNTKAGPDPRTTRTTETDLNTFNLNILYMHKNCPVVALICAEDGNVINTPVSYV